MAQIPPERLFDWSNSGAGQIPEYTNIITSSDLGLDNQGKTDNSAILNYAIDTAHKPVMFLIEEGEYLFNNTIIMKSNVTISGYSSEKTFLKFDMHKKSLRCFSISGSADTKFYDIISGFSRAGNYLVCKNSDLFRPGDFIELRQENGDWDSSPAAWAKYSVGQVLTINHINKDTLFLNETLRIDYTASLNPQIRILNPIRNCEVRYLNIERIDLPETGAPYNILFSYASNCRVSGIESNKSVGSHVMITLSKNITVCGSYFHHGFIFDGNGTKGYGVTINNHASDCLIENNIFKFLRHSMMVKHGANGNVFACNYSREPNRSEPISNLSGDISLHGHFAYANLFESNIVQNIFIDDYWGPSGPLNTFFRNRAQLYGIISTSEKSDSMNFVGNETTNTATFMAQFSIIGTGHYNYANNILGKIIPEGTNNLTLESIYYDDKPEFWDIADPFPSIGLPNDLDKYTIPAKYRYEHENKKTVGEYIPVSVPSEERAKVKLYPNPATEYIEIEIDGRSFNNVIDIVKLYDMNGRLIPSVPLFLSYTENGKVKIKINISTLLVALYFVHINGQIFKFVKIN